MPGSYLPRVVHVVNRLPGGGMEHQALQLVERLNGSGCFAASVAVQNAADPRLSGLPELPFAPRLYPLQRMYDTNAVRQLRRFADSLRKNEVRIIHTHDFYTTTFGIAAGVLAGVPVRVAARRELDVFDGMRRKIERLAYRGACAIVANCFRLERQLILEGVPADRIVVIRNGIDSHETARTDPGDRDGIAISFGLSPSLRYVVMVANVHNVAKHHELLITAMGGISARFRECAIVFAGNTEAARLTKLRGLAREMGISDRVFFIGHCERTRLAALLRLAEFCVLASRSEGLPNVILEYMAAGRAVVATDVGGVSELVCHGQTGFLVGRGDADALGGRIARLLSNPDLAARMGAAGRHRVLREFSFDSTLQQTMALYERLLRSRCPAIPA